MRKGRKSRTITRVVSDNISRHFRVFHSIFRFYGLKIFKDYFLPVIQEYVDSEFKGKEHQNIWKVIIFDICCAFLRTFKNYYDQGPEIYDNLPYLMYKLYDPKIIKQLRGFYSESLHECFYNRKIDKLDGFLKTIIQDIPDSAPTKTEKSLWLFNILSGVFGWRSTPYLKLLTQRILSWDPSKLKISANFSEEVPNPLRLAMHKNFDEIWIMLCRYIYLAYKTTSSKTYHLPLFLNTIINLFRRGRQFTRK